MKAFVGSWCGNIVSQHSFPGTMDLQLVLYMSFWVHVLGPVHVELFHLNFGHDWGVRVPCDYGKMSWPALRVLHHPTDHKGKESSGQPESTDSKLKHTVRTTIREHVVGGEWLAYSFVFVLRFVFVWSCVLRSHQRCTGISYVSISPDDCEMSLAISFPRLKN